MYTYRIISPTKEVLTESVTAKLILALNKSPDSTPDYFYVNSKNKVLLLKHNLLNQLLLLSKQGSWESANSFASEKYTIYTIPEGIYQNTKFKIKEDFENSSNKFEDAEEGSLEITSVTRTTSTTRDVKQDLNDELLTVEGEFLNLPPLTRSSVILNYIYSLFDPSYAYYGAIENEKKYYLHWAANGFWVVMDVEQVSVLHPIVSMSNNITINIANFLNTHSITIEDILNPKKHLQLIEKLTKEEDNV